MMKERAPWRVLNKQFQSHEYRRESYKRKQCPSERLEGAPCTVEFGKSEMWLGSSREEGKCMGWRRGAVFVGCYLMPRPPPLLVLMCVDGCCFLGLRPQPLCAQSLSP